MITAIRFFWNGIKINGEPKLIKCSYSLDNHHDHSESVSICAKQYGAMLPHDLFTVINDTDIYSDFHDTDRATLTPAHPLYVYARFAAEKAEIRSLSKPANCVTLERRSKLAGLQGHSDPGQPTAADLEAVEAMKNATKVYHNRSNLIVFDCK